jgi:hypothetical protein
MTDHRTPPAPGSLLAEIHAIAASLDREALEPDLSDPALLELVDRSVAPYEHALTPEGLAEARATALYVLATRPDMEPVLERVRAQLAKHGSGVRAKRSAARLEAVARQKQGGR